MATKPKSKEQRQGLRHRQAIRARRADTSTIGKAIETEHRDEASNPRSSRQPMAQAEHDIPKTITRARETPPHRRSHDEVRRRLQYWIETLAKQLPQSTKQESRGRAARRIATALSSRDHCRRATRDAPLVPQTEVPPSVLRRCVC